MKNILLVCAAGMSTSMLVKRMQAYAESINTEVNINAMSISEAKEKIKKNEADVVCLVRKFVSRKKRSKTQHKEIRQLMSSI